MDKFTAPDQKIVNMLPVLVSGHDVIKLLSVSKLQDVSVQAMMKSISDTMDEEFLRDSVKGLCFGTTAFNTG
jgi:hypothetical protein